MFFNRSIFVVLALGGLLASCGGSQSGEAKRAEDAAPVRVSVIAVSPEQWPDVFEVTGTVRARTASTISSRVMGYVQSVSVQTGDRVQAGQTLATLDSRDFNSALSQAQAGLAEARSAQPEVAAAVASAAAQLELARTTLGRMQDLLDKKSVSQQEYDEAAARVKVAEARHAMAQAKRVQLESKINQAEQAVQQATIMKGYTEIKAPFAGRVTAKQVEPGVLAAPGMALLELEQEGGYRLEAGVEESRLGTVKTGQTVTVTLDAVGSPVQGRVSEIVPAIDAASRSFIVKIDLPAQAPLRGGLFGRALFPLGERSVVAAPQDAVMAQGQVMSVMVADGGTARLRMVTLGAARDGKVEVLSGLQAGDQLIHPRPAGLQDGGRVEVSR